MYCLLYCVLTSNLNFFNLIVSVACELVMACNSSGCESGCYDLEKENESKIDAVDNGVNQENVCVKCKCNEPMTFGDGGADDGRFCTDCFRNNVFGKFRLAVTSHAMITPSDNVLVAFSGGSSSRFQSLLSLISVFGAIDCCLNLVSMMVGLLFNLCTSCKSRL